MAGAAAIFLAALLGCSGNIITVNGEGISRSEFKKEVERRLLLVRREDPDELKGKRGVKLREETERQVATELIKALLMAQQARKLRVSVPVDEVNRRLEEERRKRGSEEFDREMKKQGLSEADYRKVLENQALVDGLGNKICGEVTVTPDEAESFYLTHKDLFTHSAMVRAAHILLDTRGQAEVVAEEAAKGTDFATLARNLSRDQATRSNGGELGWIESGTMDPAFERAAFSLKSGQVSGVVRASDGYHVIKVLERREAYLPPFNDVKGEAIRMLESREKEEKFSDWLRTVYANAEVAMQASLGRWDPRLGMVVAK